ncbi:MAG: hypothetical protein F8N37_25600 [Telmatospirillum sp.]|nr:hypothetical protein [Telmatospirillum sp.]
MRPSVSALALTAALLLSGCGTAPMSASSNRPEGVPAAASFGQFSDIPIPAKATMDVDHSLLLGNGEGWLGRLVYSTGGTPGENYDLYRSDMPGFGWQEVSSIRGSTSVQTWQRGGRIATILIRETLMGEETTVTVSPAVNGGAGGTAATFVGPGRGPSVSTPVNQPGVTKQPLR